MAELYPPGWYNLFCNMKIQKLKQKYRYSFILLKELVITEFKLKYQGSVLGYLWSLLRPLFLFLILYLVFVHFLRVGGDVPHWPVSLLFGIVLWNFFSDITTGGLSAIVSRGDVLRKLNFPKYVIVLSSSVSALINLCLNLIVLVVIMFFAHVHFHLSSLLAPFFILEIFTFGFGIALILSTLYVRFRDINFIWEVFLQALFYGSAVIYPLSMVYDKSALIAKLFLLNPVAQAIQDARYFLISDKNMTLVALTPNVFVRLIPYLVVIAVLSYGIWLFKKRSPYFAEEV